MIEMCKRKQVYAGCTHYPLVIVWDWPCINRKAEKNRTISRSLNGKVSAARKSRITYIYALWEGHTVMNFWIICFVIDFVYFLCHLFMNKYSVTLKLLLRLLYCFSCKYWRLLFAFCISDLKHTYKKYFSVFPICNFVFEYQIYSQ